MWVWWWVFGRVVITVFVRLRRWDYDVDGNLHFAVPAHTCFGVEGSRSWSIRQTKVQAALLWEIIWERSVKRLLSLCQFQWTELYFKVMTVVLKKYS